MFWPTGRSHNVWEPLENAPVGLYYRSTSINLERRFSKCWQNPTLMLVECSGLDGNMVVRKTTLLPHSTKFWFFCFLPHFKSMLAMPTCPTSVCACARTREYVRPCVMNLCPIQGKFSSLVLLVVRIVPRIKTEELMNIYIYIKNDTQQPCSSQPFPSFLRATDGIVSSYNKNLLGRH